MNMSGEAADEVIRISLNATEVALRIAGDGAKELAVLLYTILSQQKKTKGKARLESMLRSGKELKVFSVPEGDIKRFAAEAKRYGVLYCVLRNSKGAPDNLCDIMVRAEDAAKINRIVERFRLATVDTASIRRDIEKQRFSPKPEKEGVKEESLQQGMRSETKAVVADQLLDELLGETSRTRKTEEEQALNPTVAETGKPLLSEPTLDGRKAPEGAAIMNSRERKSVHRELEEIKASRREKNPAGRDRTYERSKQLPARKRTQQRVRSRESRSRR